jgi:hypothetical protein
MVVAAVGRQAVSVLQGPQTSVVQPGGDLEQGRVVVVAAAAAGVLAAGDWQPIGGRLGEHPLQLLRVDQLDRQIQVAARRAAPQQFGDEAPMGRADVALILVVGRRVPGVESLLARC